ncbi:hypothetical protein N0V88_001110 [Collariella sp. IMI 366227]|nr:hypothetical protein N0V88_001110 [Collariella sp. IMI 366227]
MAGFSHITTLLTKEYPILYYSAIFGAIMCPLALVAPTKGKTGFQNVLLGIGGFSGWNVLMEHHTGRSITERSSERAELVDGLPTERAARNRALMEAERRRRAEAEEEEGWQEKRMEEERKALESGKGYWDLIVEQVSEVWGSGKEGRGGEKKRGRGRKE